MKRFNNEVDTITSNLTNSETREISKSYSQLLQTKEDLISMGETLPRQAEACINFSDTLDKICNVSGLARIPILMAKDQIEVEENFLPNSKPLRVFENLHYLYQRCDKQMELIDEELSQLSPFELPDKDKFQYEINKTLVNSFNILSALKKIIIDTDLSTERHIFYIHQMKKEFLKPQVIAEYYSALIFLAILKKLHIKIGTDFPNADFRAIFNKLTYLHDSLLGILTGKKIVNSNSLHLRIDPVEMRT